MEQQTQKERFAIRKLTVGAVSVLLGLAFVGMANQTVKADTGSSTEQTEQSNNKKTAPAAQTGSQSKSTAQPTKTNLSQYSQLDAFLKNNKTASQNKQNTGTQSAGQKQNNNATNTSSKTNSTSNQTAGNVSTKEAPTTQTVTAQSGTDGQAQWNYDAAAKTLHYRSGSTGNTLSSTPINATSPNTSILDSENAADLEYITFDTPVVLNNYSSEKFANLPSLKGINGLNNVDTSQATYMSWLFSGDRSLASLDLSHFDTSRTTDMSYMFNNTPNLTNLDLSHFNTSRVTNMADMFNISSYSDGSKRTSLDLSSFDTRQVTDMSGMFSNNNNLTDLTLHNFNTANVTNMANMFSGIGASTLDLSSFVTNRVTDMSWMFSGASRLTSLDLSHFDTSNVRSMAWMFNGTNLSSLNLAGFNTSQVTDMSSMFSSMSKLTELDLANFDTSRVTNMQNMFAYTSSLPSLDLSRFATNQVTNMQNMFNQAGSPDRFVLKTGQQRWAANAQLGSGHNHAKAVRSGTIASPAGSALTLGQLQNVYANADQNQRPAESYVLYALSDKERYQPLVQAASAHGDVGQQLTAASLLTFSDRKLNADKTVGDLDALTDSINNDQKTVTSISWMPNKVLDNSNNLVTGGVVSDASGTLVADQDTSDTNQGNALIKIQYGDGSFAYVPVNLTVRTNYAGKYANEISIGDAIVTHVYNTGTVTPPDFTDSDDIDNIITIDDLDDASDVVDHLGWAPGSGIPTHIGDDQTEYIIAYYKDGTQSAPLAIAVNAFGGVSTGKATQVAVNDTDSLTAKKAKSALVKRKVREITSNFPKTTFSWAANADGTGAIDLSHWDEVGTNRDVYVVIKYRDGSKQMVKVPLHVKGLAEQNTVTQTKDLLLHAVTSKDVQPSAEFSNPSSFLANASAVTGVTWKTRPDVKAVTDSGKTTAGTLQLKFSDGSTADLSNVKAAVVGAQSADKATTVQADAPQDLTAINAKAALTPASTAAITSKYGRATFAWAANADGSGTPDLSKSDTGNHDRAAYVVVNYHDGTKQVVEVPLHVKAAAQTVQPAPTPVPTAKPTVQPASTSVSTPVYPAATPIIKPTPELPVTEVLLKHDAYFYNDEGQRVNDLVAKRGSRMTASGVKTINGRKFYQSKETGYYLAAGNSRPVTRALTHNAYLYDEDGKRLEDNVLTAGSQVATYGSPVKIKGKQYYISDQGYLKYDNFPETADQPEQVESVATDDSGESKVLGHPAYLYDENGNRVGNLILAQNSIAKIHGTKIINGRKYYLTTNNHYLVAGNIDGTKRLTSRRSIVYNRYGIKTAKRLAKKGQVTTYGSKVKIGRHIYYSLGNNKYVRAANLKH
ncbi:BspA family leucine-rich repeat surface protein [Lactobacillus sp. ESL0791]|uniref:BspA family leucine-rich repeat surface protein n=1 Tax=Lactobacillus sp. ESL0791 TaxID=2983234 RepID=UPI0023F882F6|nr:BspA family leucine-rich repeat surface protein [Lactobacillus sp. ESL0791]MDF7639608.1 BspA family leucine-rich repeat surface protein [Lactobacillus sp. ESL0791]